MGSDDSLPDPSLVSVACEICTEITARHLKFPKDKKSMCQLAGAGGTVIGNFTPKGSSLFLDTPLQSAASEWCGCSPIVTVVKVDQNDVPLNEILDEDDNPVPSGETGRIVATGLLNRGMVFIRYDTGDLGSLDPSPCSCGRGLIRIRRLEGRTRDLVRTPDGNLIHGVSFNEIVLGHPWVDRYQVVQLDEHNLTLNVAVTGEVADERMESLKEEVNDLCGLKVKLLVNRPFETTRGGKALVIISRLEEIHDS